MKKTLLLLLMLVLTTALAGCGEEEASKKEVKSVESSDKSNEKEEVKSDSESYDQVLLDDDVATVTLKTIETVKDDIFGDEHKVKLEIENKSDKTIVVQSDQMSIDGLMVDDMVVFSETVAGGKRANGSLDIMALDDELPELNENLEFTLIVIDDETFDRITETDVKVDLK